MLKILNILILLSLFAFEIGYAKEQLMNKNKKNGQQNQEDMDAQIFKAMDTDKNNCVSFEEFKAFFNKRREQNPPSSPENNMQEKNMNSEINEKIQ